MHIAIVYSLPTDSIKSLGFSDTDEDTAASAREVSEALKTKGWKTTLIPIATNTLETITTIHADCIFNLIEWTGADMEAGMRATQLIEDTRIPYTGASPLLYQITSNKVLLKHALESIAAPVSEWQVFVTGDEPIRDGLPYPVIVKPSLEHCSIGLSSLSIAENKDELKGKINDQIVRFQQPILVERFLTGSEYQVTLLEKDGELLVLPPAEIYYLRPTYRSLLSYEGRWDVDHADYHESKVREAVLSVETIKKIEAMCTNVFRNLDYHDYARYDLRSDDLGNIYFLEANSNPGLGDDDDYGMTVSYKAAGMTFTDFVLFVVQSALQRFS